MSTRAGGAGERAACGVGGGLRRRCMRGAHRARAPPPRGRHDRVATRLSTRGQARGAWLPCGAACRVVPPLTPPRQHRSRHHLPPRSGHYVGVHASSFKDYGLKPEILRAIVDNAFEHPSEGERRGGARGAAPRRATAATARRAADIL